MKPILIVDDEPETCWALEHVLLKQGMPSERALAGEEALTLARRRAYSLAFLDAKLPDIDGLELARRIHQIDARLPIILVSGYFSKDDQAVRDAKAAGLILEAIGKPFLHAEILRAAAAALGSASPASGAASLEPAP